MGSRPALLITKKGALDSQPQVIKFTSCLPRVGGSLRVLRLPLPLTLVAMILLKVALNTKIQINLVRTTCMYNSSGSVRLYTNILFVNKRTQDEQNYHIE